MTTPNPGYVHPLFDEQSFYRLGCQLSVWSDQGQGSIRRFFEALRLKHLWENWDPDSDRVDDWGFEEEINQEIHKLKKQVYTAANMEEERVRQKAEGRRRAQAATAAAGNFWSSLAGRGVLKAPRLLRVDLGTSSVPRLEVRREADWQVTGMNEKERLQNQGLIQAFHVAIKGVPPGRKCMLLLLTHALLEQLAGFCEGVPPDDPFDPLSVPRKDLKGEQEELDTIRWLLDPEVLAPSDPRDESDLWRANEVSLALGCAAGHEGISTDEGDFIPKDVMLDKKCPHLDEDTWLLFCTGPVVA